MPTCQHVWSAGYEARRVQMSQPVDSGLSRYGISHQMPSSIKLSPGVIPSYWAKEPPLEPSLSLWGSLLCAICVILHVSKRTKALQISQISQLFASLQCTRTEMVPAQSPHVTVGKAWCCFHYSGKMLPMSVKSHPHHISSTSRFTFENLPLPFRP